MKKNALISLARKCNVEFKKTTDQKEWIKILDKYMKDLKPLGFRKIDLQYQMGVLNGRFIER